MTGRMDTDITCFSRARWFSRGWNLQELIAPSPVLFYNRVWNIVGSKSSLHRTLAKITPIDEPVLIDKEALPSYAIARRMSWAAHRSTSREENRDYSMLGIFNINMSLIYGEPHKAFIRLQEEIIKQSTDHSIFAWKYCLNKPQTDLMFAKEPKQFAHTAKVAPRRGIGIPIDLPYQLTNGGFISAEYAFSQLRMSRMGS